MNLGSKGLKAYRARIAFGKQLPHLLDVSNAVLLIDKNAVPDAIFESVKRTVFSLLMPGKPVPAPEETRLHA